jgi:hypothetical protein
MGVFFERGISQIHTYATRSSCANGQRAGKRAAHAFGTLSQSPRVPRPAQFSAFRLRFCSLRGGRAAKEKDALAGSTQLKHGGMASLIGVQSRPCSSKHRRNTTLVPANGQGL